MHDTLEYFSEDPVHRRFHHGKLTFRGLYVDTEQFVLPLSHDEVVHGKGSLLRKMPGDEWQRFANLRALLVEHVGPARQEAALHGRRAGDVDGVVPRPSPALGAAGCADARRRRSLRRGPRPRLRVDRRRCGPPITIPTGFAWIDASDVEASVYAWIRRGGGGPGGRGPQPDAGAPPWTTASACRPAGRWVEAINSDSEHYGGSNLGNLGGVEAVEESWHGQPASAVADPPPAERPDPASRRRVARSASGVTQRRSASVEGRDVRSLRQLLDRDRQGERPVVAVRRRPSRACSAVPRPRSASSSVAATSIGGAAARRRCNRSTSSSSEASGVHARRRAPAGIAAARSAAGSGVTPEAAWSCEIGAAPRPGHGRQVVRRHAGERLLRVAGGLDALEQCEAGREQAATTQLFADAGRHGAEVLADDDRAGAVRLERHDLEQLVGVGSDVGAP